MRKIALAAITFYQKAVSPFLPQSCRFSPSCSHYAADAIERYGFSHGMAKALFRLLKCHPFHPGGYDPVK